MTKVFGALRQDVNGNLITDSNAVMTQDATSGTTLKSPLAITTGTTTINIPSNAVEMKFSSNVDVRWSEDPSMTRYDKQYAGMPLSIGVANTDALYFRGDSTSGTLYFSFYTV